MACSLALAVVRARSGVSSHSRSMRLPIPVAQVSSNDNSVGEVSPRSVWVSSRLRRVVAGKLMSASLVATLNSRTWTKSRPCVWRAYSISAPAAAWACSRSWASKACRLCVCSCSSSKRRPRLTSNCHAGRSVSPKRWPPALAFEASSLSTASNVSVLSALCSNSCGATRATQVANSSGLHCAMCTTPCVMANHAKPNVLRGPWCTAITLASALSPSSSDSVSVPGVTMRTTPRSTGPLPVTSPICSQMATDSPKRMSLAR